MLYRKKEGGFRFGHVGKATLALRAVLDVFRLQITCSANRRVVVSVTTSRLAVLLDTYMQVQQLILPWIQSDCFQGPSILFGCLIYNLHKI
uniref:Uncharacterized protein n=1 Tax=Aegilops tauschii subsp. strangulata TaxID=200361 RepID=A0A453MKM3_AEGTS